MFSVCGSGRLLVAVALGSGPGCSWGLLPVAFGLLSVSCFFLVGSKPGEERVPTPKPAVICVHFMSGIPSCSMFWDFSSVGGTLGCVLRDGSDGWRSPVSWGDNTGGEVLYFFRQPSRVSPADWFRSS